MTIPVTPRLVAIDTDPGVDDALALMLALRSPELRVELITTVAGNVTLEMATANARRLLALIDAPTWPVLAQGAAHPLRRPLHTATYVHGNDGLGGLTRLYHRDGTPRYPLPATFTAQRQAPQRLIQLVQTHGHDLTVVALGPLTNIARAIQRAPDTMRQLGCLVIMGGAISVPGNVTPTAEFNIFVDPHAADIVLSSGLPMTLVPLDITRQVRLTRSFFSQMVSGSGTKLAQATRQMTRHLLDGPQRQRGMPMHDPLAVAVAMDPSLVQCTRLPLQVETQGQQTVGMTVADRRDSPYRASDVPLVDVALEVDADRFLALFAARVLVNRARQRGRRARQGHVIVVGSANTDLTVQVPHLPQRGETVLGTALQTACGGKGANQAMAAKRAGARVAFVGKLGRDSYGQSFAQHLRHEGVDLSGLRWTSELPSGAALIAVDRHGQNQIAVASGANAAFLPVDLDSLPDLLDSAQVLVVQLENPLPTVESALRQAKQAGVTTVLNPAPARRLPARLTPLIDVLVPNEVEAAMLCGQPVNTPRQAQAAARRLRRMGYHTVVITLGKHGLVYAGESDSMSIPGLEVQAVDATAAGDTFVGYLACALAEGKALLEALAFANTAAALSVTRAGAFPSIPLRQEVERLQTPR
ncbi:MAG: ribokinase [Candidatus Tectomicrobia bacterium]